MPYAHTRDLRLAMRTATEQARRPSLVCTAISPRCVSKALPSSLRCIHSLLIALSTLPGAEQSSQFISEQRKKHMGERDEQDEQDAPKAEERSFLAGQAVGGKPAHTETTEDQGNRLDSPPHLHLPTPDLQLLRLDHAPALLAFELENRAYFAASIPDRGDEFFAEFDTRHAQWLAWQAAGTDYFHLLVAEGGEVVGRVNLVEVANRSADLGYRIAQKATGQGLATAAVRKVRELAVTEYGLTELRARVKVDNPASRKVLEHNGFITVGALTLNGKPALSYICELR
jgi:[ribosomal protein S5]-alanine N-acetyltransferase